MHKDALIDIESKPGVPSERVTIVSLSLFQPSPKFPAISGHHNPYFPAIYAALKPPSIGATGIFGSAYVFPIPTTLSTSHEASMLCIALTLSFVHFFPEIDSVFCLSSHRKVIFRIRFSLLGLSKIDYFYLMYLLWFSKVLILFGPETLTISDGFFKKKLGVIIVAYFNEILPKAASGYFYWESNSDITLNYALHLHWSLIQPTYVHAAS